MTCTTVQKRLLAEPGHLSASLQAHLDECAACRDLQRRVQQIEKAVPRLPVPPSTARGAFLQRFRNEATIWETANVRLRNLKRWQITVGALAASLLLFFLAWSLAPVDRPQTRQVAKAGPPDQLLTKLLNRNLQMVVANNPKDQVVTLADLAEDLRGQSQPLEYYGGPERKDTLKDLAGWYGEVVRQGVTQAEKLPAEQRRQVLDPIMRTLNQAIEEAELLARTNAKSVDDPLYTIAFAAKNGKGQLERLVGRETSWVPELDGLERGRSLDKPERARFSLSQRGAIKRLAVPVLFASATSVIRPDNPSPKVLAYDQAQRFQRNRKLIQSLVENCVRMAEKGVVSRADSCMVVAERLAEEIQQAASERDVYRATELGNILTDLLKKGIAFNLDTASGQVPIGAAGEPAMLQIGDHVQRITNQLQDSLSRVADKDSSDQWQRIARGITEGQAKVNKALKGRGSY
jgi:hypothetical protein